jgi:hypothetical protein
MVRSIGIFVLSAVIVLGQTAGTTPFVVVDGTPLKLRLSRNLSSNIEELGNTVDFEVLEEVKIGEIVVIPKGAAAIGSVTEAVKSRRLGRAGKLNVAIDHVRTAVNDKIALRAVRESEGGSNSGKMTGAIVATSIVFFPAAPLFLLWKGKEYKIPKGTEITAYVNGDAPLDTRKYNQVTAPATAQAEPESTRVSSISTAQPMNNGNVISMMKNGFGDEVIIAAIKRCKPDFRLATDDLLELKKNQVSDGVIKAMLEQSNR